MPKDFTSHMMDNHGHDSIFVQPRLPYQVKPPINLVLSPARLPHQSATLPIMLFITISSYLMEHFDAQPLSLAYSHINATLAFHLQNLT